MLSHTDTHYSDYTANHWANVFRADIDTERTSDSPSPSNDDKLPPPPAPTRQVISGIEVSRLTDAQKGALFWPVADSSSDTEFSADSPAIPPTTVNPSLPAPRPSKGKHDAWTGALFWQDDDESSEADSDADAPVTQPVTFNPRVARPRTTKSDAPMAAAAWNDESDDTDDDRVSATADSSFGTRHPAPLPEFIVGSSHEPMTIDAHFDNSPSPIPEPDPATRESEADMNVDT